MPLLKRWERPSEGPRRNDKSRQASARLRQIKKATKAQMKRLRERGRFFCIGETVFPALFLFLLFPGDDKLTPLFPYGHSGLLRLTLKRFVFL
jgi:hypothetical protein